MGLAIKSVMLCRHVTAIASPLIKVKIRPNIASNPPLTNAGAAVTNSNQTTTAVNIHLKINLAGSSLRLRVK